MVVPEMSEDVSGKLLLLPEGVYVGGLQGMILFYS